MLECPCSMKQICNVSQHKPNSISESKQTQSLMTLMCALCLKMHIGKKIGCFGLCHFSWRSTNWCHFWSAETWNQGKNVIVHNLCSWFFVRSNSVRLVNRRGLASDLSSLLNFFDTSALHVWMWTLFANAHHASRNFFGKCGNQGSSKNFERNSSPTLKLQTINISSCCRLMLHKKTQMFQQKLSTPFNQDFFDTFMSTHAQRMHFTLILCSGTPRVSNHWNS